MKRFLVWFGEAENERRMSLNSFENEYVAQVWDSRNLLEICILVEILVSNEEEDSAWDEEGEEEETWEVELV